MRAINVDKLYYLSFVSSLDRSSRVMLDDRIEANEFYLLFSNGEVVGGYAIAHVDNNAIELRGLFSLGIARGVARAAIESIRDRYSDYLINISFYNKNNLFEIYSSLGFNYEHHVEFNPEYQSDRWDVSIDGEPDIVYMSLVA